VNGTPSCLGGRRPTCVAVVTGAAALSTSFLDLKIWREQKVEKYLKIFIEKICQIEIFYESFLEVSFKPF